MAQEEGPLPRERAALVEPRKTLWSIMADEDFFHTVDVSFVRGVMLAIFWLIVVMVLFAIVAGGVTLVRLAGKV